MDRTFHYKMTSLQHPCPIQNYDRFLNSVSINRKLSPLRNIWAIQNQAGPEMIAFGTGTPNPACFPYESVTVRTKDGRSFTLENQELDIALGYTASPGFPPLVDWLVAFQKRLHDPPYARDRPELNQLVVIPGSEDGQCKILEMVLEPGDPVLITELAYSGVLSALRPLKSRLLAVAMDQDGVKPESVEKVLRECRAPEKRPKLFIIQPNHVNPTGVSTTLERRKEIYRLACKYDLLLIEDDPYYFLTFGPTNTPPPSFLSMDTEGRVLRLDSFSKVLSAGFRVGILSGPRPLVERVVMHMGCSTQHASTFSQSMIYRFMTEYGQNGFLEHGKRVAQFYEGQCRKMLEAAKRHLTGLAEWTEPSGGMFLWMKLLGIKDSRKLIEQNALKKMVMLAPGCYFMCDDFKESPYLRASFSWASEADMDEGFRRLAEMVKEENQEL